MKSLSIRLGIILIGLISIGYAEVWGADWKVYASSVQYVGYYDAQSISYLSQKMARVWVKWEFTEKGVIDYVKVLGKKFENLDHLIYLCQINCVEKMICFLTTAYYDDRGDVIYQYSSPLKWDFIAPESASESLYKVVCK